MAFGLEREDSVRCAAVGVRALLSAEIAFGISLVSMSEANLIESGREGDAKGWIMHVLLVVKSLGMTVVDSFIGR